MILVDAVLVLAVVLLLLLVWAVVQHLILGVPFVPAPDAAIVAALTALGLRPGDIFCDLGAGDGRVLTVA